MFGFFFPTNLEHLGASAVLTQQWRRDPALRQQRRSGKGTGVAGWGRWCSPQVAEVGVDVVRSGIVDLRVNTVH